MKMEKLTIIKVGGKIVEDAESLNHLLADFPQYPVINCWFMAEVVLLLK